MSVQEVVINMGLEFRREIWARYTDRRTTHIQVAVDIKNKISQKECSYMERGLREEPQKQQHLKCEQRELRKGRLERSEECWRWFLNMSKQEGVFRNVKYCRKV